MPEYLARFTIRYLQESVIMNGFVDREEKEEYRFKAPESKEALCLAKDHRNTIGERLGLDSSCATLDALLEIEEISVK